MIRVEPVSSPGPEDFPGDDRPESVKAAGLATRIIAICFAPVVPPGLGYWIDQSAGTSPWFLVAGLALGLLVGFVQARGLMKELAEDQEFDH